MISLHAKSASGTRRARRNPQSGFTILEVAMAGFVMVMAITTSITTIQRGFASIDSARNMVIAGQIMQCEIEKMRVSPWTTANVTGIVDYTNTSPAITIDPNFAADNPTIANRFTVTRTVSTPMTDMRQITLTVTWTNYDGRNLSRSYTFYYARYGLYDYFSS